jgi:hypothetical protein
MAICQQFVDLKVDPGPDREACFRSLQTRANQQLCQESRQVELHRETKPRGELSKETRGGGTVRVALPALTSSFCTILALQFPILAQAADPQLPVSMERIRAGLKQPPSLLQAPQPSGDIPMFRIEVLAPPFVLLPVDEKPFDPTFGLPSVGELLMDGIEGIRSSAVHYKRRHAERRARKEVDGALAAFCAVRACSTPDTVK